MKLYKDRIEWGDKYLKPKYRGGGLEPFYFMWFWIDKDMRKELRKDPEWKLFGVNKFWYDCPHAQLNLYFFGFGWSSPWTTMDE